jgi:hypothetical protein
MGDRYLAAVALGHLSRRIGLDLMAAIEAPYDQPNASRGGVA